MNERKMIDAVIEEVIIDSSKIQPIIVNFENGHLKDTETNKIKVGLFKDKKHKNTVLALSNGKTVYKGYRPDIKKKLINTMLVIHNRKTGKVKLIQAERWDVAPVLDHHVDVGTDNKLDQTIALNKQFGSKKVKRRTEQFERMKIDVDSVKQQLETLASNIDVQKTELEPTENNGSLNDLLPLPINRNATHVSEIYNVNDIVPDNILKSLYDQIDEGVKEIELKPAFFVETVKYCKNDERYTTKLAMLLYIQSVLLWLNTSIKMGKKSFMSICPYSADVNNYIIDSYSVPSNHGRLRPNSMKDKGIVHCLILAIMIWNYKLDLDLFMSMFKIRISRKKLLELSKWICAVPLGDKKSVVFKLPLPSQPVTKSKIKKKK